MNQKVKYALIGTVAFVFAATAANVISVLVNAVIPNPNKVDPAGKLDPDPQTKSKAEWLQQLEGGGPRQDNQPSEPEKPASTPEPQSVQAQPEAAPIEKQPEKPAPQKAVAPLAAPPAPTVGPGNFDSPPPFSPPPAPRTGPGNM